MPGNLASQKLQFGREVTAKTAVAATTIWRGVGGMPHDNRPPVFVEEHLGIITNTDRTYIPKIEAAIALAATPATFEQLPHLLEMGIKAATGTQDGAGSGYIYAYPIGTTTTNTIKTYTIEGGDNQDVQEVEGCFAEQITISGTGGESVMMSANIIGCQTSNASFTGALTIPTVEAILAQKGQLFIDNVGGTFGTTAVTGTLLDFTLTINTGQAAKYTIDGNQLIYDFSYFNKEAYEVTLDVTLEHSASAVTELRTNMRAETTRMIRLDFTGNALGTSGTTYSNKKLLIDLYGKWENPDALDSNEGNSILTATFRSGYNVADATDAMQITVVNELTALP